MNKKDIEAADYEFVKRLEDVDYVASIVSDVMSEPKNNEIIAKMVARFLLKENGTKEGLFTINTVGSIITLLVKEEIYAEVIIYQLNYGVEDE